MQSDDPDRTDVAGPSSRLIVRLPPSQNGESTEVPAAIPAPRKIGTQAIYRLCGIDHEDDLTLQLHRWTRSFVSTQPRFSFIDRLGEGSQGFILRVFDRDCRREVALKTLNSSKCDQADINRFINEAQITAQLEHPGIVPVHDFGVLPSGSVYYTMKKVQGESLADYAHNRFGRAEERFQLLEIFLRVGEAIAFAHSRGVVHRDIKPRNIMVGSYGEVLVIDWGLAKVLSSTTNTRNVSTLQAHCDESSDRHGTRHGHALGTPAYMSPEQARGESADPRSDIYSLGVILYEMLSGTSPYQRGDVSRTLEQVAHDRWLRLNKHPDCGDLPRSLIAIVHKAMSYYPGQRYQSVDLLVSDVEHFLSGMTVSAYQESPQERLMRVIRHHRRSLAAVFLAIVMAITFILMHALVRPVQVISTPELFRMAFACEHEHLWSEAEHFYRLILNQLPQEENARIGVARVRHHLDTVMDHQDQPALAELQRQARIALGSDDPANLRLAQQLYRDALALAPDNQELREMVADVSALCSDLSALGSDQAKPSPEQLRTYAQNFRIRIADSLRQRADQAQQVTATPQAQMLRNCADLWNDVASSGKDPALP